jgi:putative peptidoglycan lipid II flippase
MILGALLLRGFFDVPITALAAGVLIGGCVQLVLQLPVLWRKGFPFRLNFDFDNPEVRRIALLMLPATFGVGVYYLNITVSAILASLLPQGSVSYLYYAQRLFEFPQGIFTVSVAQAVLPSMSRQAADGDMTGMRESLAFGLRLTLFITIPAMTGLLACSTPIFSLLFMGGEFDYAKAVNSAQALFYYSFGLSFVALTRVLAPAFYALKDTKTPVWTAFIAFLLNVVFSLLLMRPLLHGGLALATTLSALANMIMLLWLLRRKIGPFGGRGVTRSGIKALIASLPMGAVVYYICQSTDWSLAAHKLTKTLVLGGAVAAGILVYAVASRLLKSEEALELSAILQRKFGRKTA